MFHTAPQAKVSQKTEVELKELNQNLIYAIYDYDKEALYEAIKKGANINVSDAIDDNNELMEPSIHAAINTNNLPALKILLEAGARVTTLNKRRVPAIARAVAEGNFDMVQELLLYGADPNTYYGRSLLAGAVLCLPSLAVIKYSAWPTPTIRQKLLDWYEQKGEFSTQDPDIGVPFPEQTVQLRATYKGMQEIVALLISKGAHVWIPSDSNVTILDFLEDPIKYKRQIIVSGCRFIDSVDKDILTFEVDVKNRNNSAPPIKVIVDYDLREIRKRIQTYVDLSAKHNSVDVQALGNGLKGKISDQVQDLHKQNTLQLVQRLEGVEQSFQSETVNLQQQIQDVRVVGNFDRKDEKKNFIVAISGHPNAEEAYKKFQIGLQEILTSARAVAGGGVDPSSGPLSMVASVLDLSTNLTDMIPIVGSAISKLFQGASKVTEIADRKRQINIFKNISALVTDKEAIALFESIARELVTAYHQQFDKIATEEKAREKMKGAKKLLQTAKQKIIKDTFKSPVKRVIEFALLRMINDILYDVDLYKDEIKEKGLKAVLLKVVTQCNPSEKFEKIWSDINKGLGIADTIPIFNGSGEISDKTWSPCDFWTKPGIVVVTEYGDCRYFVGVSTHVTEFGWRLGSLSDVEALGLKETKEPEISYMPLECSPLQTPKIRSTQFYPVIEQPTVGPQLLHLPSTQPSIPQHASLNGNSNGITYGYSRQRHQVPPPPFNPEAFEPSAPPMEANKTYSPVNNGKLITGMH